MTLNLLQKSSFPIALLGALAAVQLAGCNSGTPDASKAAPSAAGNTTTDTSAGNTTSTSGKRYKIGFANLNETIPFAVKVQEGMEAAAKKAGNIDLVELDNKMSGQTALDNANTFITQGVQGVVEFQTDEKFGKAIMTKLNDAKIPVIAIDIPMPGATFFGVNNPLAGQMAGKGLGDWVKKNWGGKIDNLIMLELPQSGPVPAARLKGQRDGLESVIGKIPEAQVKHLDSKNTLDEARKVVTDTLSTIPDAKHIAVVCINDDTAAGAIVAAEGANRKDQVAVVAVDGSDLGRGQIRKPDSRQIGTTASFPEKYGEHILPKMVAAIDGTKLPDAFYTTHVFLTKDNIDKYYPNDKK